MANEPTAPTRAALQEQLASFVLWIDGVGGYLVCLSHRLTIGQANVTPPVDLALLADVSRHHATIQRDAESYFLEAVRTVLVNGKPIEKTMLKSGDRITLGKTCQLQFWQAAANSTSARLDMASGHRFADSVQAAVLMAETLTIGPTAQSHIQVAEMTQPLILFRNRHGLGARWSGNLQVDGRTFPEKAPLEAGSTLSTDQITLALEART